MSEPRKRDGESAAGLSRVRTKISCRRNSTTEVAAEVDDDDEATVDVGEEDPAEAFKFAGPQAGSPATPRTRPGPKPKDPDKSLKATAVPILATVGFLMLCLTGWAVLILLNSHVPLWDRPNAKTMAVVMLMCGPIAAVLFAGSYVFFRQIQREKEAYKLATAKPAKPAPKPPSRSASPKPKPR